jgi:NADP-reducing hydrogenase subunit HndD
MGCPGGCVNGGGQPIQPQYVRDTVDLKAVRAQALYAQDQKMELRKSHNNPIIKEVYENYFKGGYGCHKAHHTLHTSYVARQKFAK